MSTVPRVLGVFRVAGNPLELSLIFDRRPTDDELRMVHLVLNASARLVAAASALTRWDWTHLLMDSHVDSDDVIQQVNELDRAVTEAKGGRR